MRPGPSLRAGRPQPYLFHYVISGTGIIRPKYPKQSIEYHVRSGQGFMIFPSKSAHTLLMTSFRGNMYGWNLTALRSKEILDGIGISQNAPIYRPKYKDVARQMIDEMLYIIKNTKASSFHLIGHLYLFLDCLIRSSASPIARTGGRLRDFYIKEAISFIEQNFQNDISVEDIAAFCSLNRSCFGKIFHDTVNQIPSGLLISYRMAKAARAFKAH